MKTYKNSTDLYFNLCKTPTFTFDDVMKFYENDGSARSALTRLLSSGKAFKIRNNLYTCTNAETGGPLAKPFEIASAITPSSYISHHSALEFYAAYNQVYVEVQVSSETKFKNFYFDGYLFKYIHSPSSDGVIVAVNNPHIKVTDKERTLVDVIQNMDKYVGLEETIKAIENFSDISEEKLLKSLKVYKNRRIYQKISYLLYEDRKRLGLSSNFFKTCMKMSGKGKGYLSSSYKNGRYDKRWRLVIPNVFESMKTGGLVDANI